jgi:Flp pilus assembly pilin Flp
MRKLFRRYLRDDSGQGMVEYILIIGLIVLFIIVALIAFKDELLSFLDKIKTWLVGHPPPG